MRSRRTILAAGLAFPVVALGRAVSASHLTVTPFCTDDSVATHQQTAGPFFLPDSPERMNLAADDSEGQQIALQGCVLDLKCHPVPGTIVDIWQADHTGAYDTGGYRLRGHQITGGSGTFAFSTVVPGRYPGRTPHFHVRVQPPGGRLLTTQLYLPSAGGSNEDDGLFDPALLVVEDRWGEARRARFDFVVDV